MFATLAGSYPRPADLTPEEALAAVLADQVDAGLGLLSDGLVHAADQPSAGLVAAWERARARAAALAPGLPVKLAVLGPCAATAAEPTPPTSIEKVVTRLRATLEELAEAGCPYVEVHEPAATLPADHPGRAAFAAAHGALLDGLAGRLHAALAVTGGDAVGLGAVALFAAPYRSHLFDLLDGPENWRLIVACPGDRGVIVGVGDAGGQRRTVIEEIAWAASYAASTQGRGMNRVGVAPSGALGGLDRASAQEVIGLIGDAAAAMSEGREALLARLDPRSIDIRSAALGYHGPRSGRRP